MKAGPAGRWTIWKRKVDKSGRITVPKWVRDDLDWHPGMLLRLEYFDDAETGDMVIVISREEQR